VALELGTHHWPQLYAGCRRVIYHGPVGGALPFFETLGFVCPTRKDPASFLQEVTTSKGALLAHICLGQFYLCFA